MVSFRLLATYALAFTAPLALALSPAQNYNTLNSLYINFDVLVPSLESDPFDAELLQDINAEFHNILKSAEPLVKELETNPEPILDSQLAFDTYVSFKRFAGAQTSVLNALIYRAEKGDFAKFRKDARHFATALRALKATFKDLSSGITVVEFEALKSEIINASGPLSKSSGLYDEAIKALDGVQAKDGKTRRAFLA